MLRLFYPENSKDFSEGALNLLVYSVSGYWAICLEKDLDVVKHMLGMHSQHRP